MRVLVSDTSVIVDLERGNLLEAVFRLDWEFAVPDLLFTEELEEYSGQQLLELGLQIAQLDGAGVQQALKCRQEIPQLSLPDAFAATLAQLNDWTLLTGDSALRRYAESIAVPCHGVLWVIDELESSGALGRSVLHTALSEISSHPRCRLPRGEVSKRLRKFGRNRR